MNMDSKHTWSVFINVALTATTAILAAFGFNVG